MNAREFFDKVAQMRSMQKEYFRTRSKTALQESKRLEREVDMEIERVEGIVGKTESEDTSLFNNELL